METLDYNRLLLVSLWQYNHHGDEGLTPALSRKRSEGLWKSLLRKWTGYFNQNLWDMIAYFRSEKENGQKFCDWLPARSNCTNKNALNMKYGNFMIWKPDSAQQA